MRAKDKPNLERMRELINQLTEADIAYYKNDAPIMTDLEYDRLTEELTSLERDILFATAYSSRQRKSSKSQPHLRKLTQKIAAGPVKAETVHLRWANSAAGYWPGSSPLTQ